MKALLAFAIVGSCIALPPRLDAAISNWQSSSGLLPQQTWPAWEQKLSGAPTPTATPLADALQLNSGSNWSQTLYYQQSGRVLAFPESLAIEARLRVVSSTGTSYCPCDIYWTPGNGTGNSLSFRDGKVFLWQSSSTQGPPATVDISSALHTYRIEVDGLAGGSAIRVYQDGNQILTGATFTNASWHGSTPMIWWGDGTSNGSAVSDWASFRHNALARIPVSNGRILFGYLGKYLSAFNTVTGQGQYLCADPNVPASPYNYVVQLTPQPGTGLLYGLITPSVSGYPTPKLLRLDPFTGQSAVVGFIQTADGLIKDVEGLAFHPLTGELWGSMRTTTDLANVSPNLIRIDPTTGLAVRSGQLDPTFDIDTLGFDNAGNMYAVDGLTISENWGTYVYRLQKDGLGNWYPTPWGTVLHKVCNGFAYSPEEAAFYCAENTTRKLYRIVLGGSTATELGIVDPAIPVYSVAFATPAERSPLSVSSNSGNLAVRCPSNCGLTYQLWSSLNLTAWQTQGAPLEGDGSPLEWPLPVGPEPAKFFRVQTLDYTPP